MHATLSQRFNVVMVVLWTLLLALLLLTTRPFPVVELGAGVVLGLIAGYLQIRVISGRSSELLAAKSAMDVRRVMWGVLAGRSAIILMWINGIGLLIWAMAFAPNMFIGAWVAGVAAFGLSREMAAFPGVLHLGRLRNADAKHGV